MRDIDDVLTFRQDISPFLVHLTRGRDGGSAKDILTTILDARSLVAGDGEVSDAKYGGFTTSMTPAEKRECFGAICFTETPLAEAHCLLEISRRQVNLEPYGLVFLKDLLAKKGVSPVLYLNNLQGKADAIVQAIFPLITSNLTIAKNLLPLVSSFGLKIQHPGAQNRSAGRNDWRWEREWRYPAANGALELEPCDLFLGLCPDDEISFFDGRYKPNLGIEFIDPRRDTKWYATKLLRARHRVGLKTSVV